jgi:hypothetical protein
MEPLRSSRRRDLAGAGERPEPPAIDPAPLVGTWENFDRASRGMARLVISADNRGMTVRAFGAGAPDPVDWGEVPGAPFADGVALDAGVAFTAAYEFPGMSVTLACYLNKRLLVVDAYTRFEPQADGGGRAGYFARDHFYIPSVR